MNSSPLTDNSIDLIADPICVSGVPGCYLLHFDPPYHRSDWAYGVPPKQHYLGVSNDIGRRIGEHGTMAGAKITYAARQAGVAFTLVRVWPGGDYELEQALKARHEHSDFCPICRGY